MKFFQLAADCCWWDQINKTPTMSNKSIKRKINAIFLGKVLSSSPLVFKKGITKAPNRGTKTIADNQGK